MLCINFTASIFISQYLCRSSNLQERIPKAEVHRIISMNSLQVDYVFEVPAY